MELIHQAELGRYRNSWDELVLDMAVPSPFLRTWWLDHMPTGEPSYLLAIDEGGLIGGVPLQVQGWHGVARVHLLGQGPLAPVYGDLVATSGREQEVAGAVVRWLSKPGAPWRQRVVDLAGFYAEGYLADAFRVQGHAVSPFGVTVFAGLGPDRTAFLATRPKKLRKSIAEADRRFSRNDVTYRSLPAEEVESGLETLRQLHQMRWGDQSSFLPSWPAFKAAALAGTDKGEVKMAEVIGPDGTRLAAALFMRLGERLLAYQAGRDAEHKLANGAGLWLYWKVLLEESETSEFDLGPGAQDYKQAWQTGERPLGSTRFAIGTLAATVLAAAKARSAARARSEAKANTTPSEPTATA